MNSICRPTLILLCLVFSPFGLAEDIISSIQNGGQVDDENGGYLEIGFIAGYVHNPLVRHNDRTNDEVLTLDIGGEYRYHKFFVEANQGTQDGINLGFKIWSNERWSIDALGASIFGIISNGIGEEVKAEDSEATRNKKLESDNVIYYGTGIRITRYQGKYVLQYRLISDMLFNNGIVSSLRAGRAWQYQNWTVTGIASLVYGSAKNNTHWFGVTEFEASEKYPAYSSRESVYYSAVLSFARPLSENWVLRGFTGIMTMPEEARNSPLVDDHHLTLSLITLNYVF